MTHGTHILWDDIATTLDEGIGLGCTRKRDRGTWRCSTLYHLLETLQLILVRITCRKDYINYVTLYLLVHVDLSHHLTGTYDVLWLEDGLGLLKRLG